MKSTVIGLGHLGVVAAGGLAVAGRQVTGVDVDKRTIRRLRSGEAADWEAMAAAMQRPKFLFDGRNALDPGMMGRLGFQYAGVGRGLEDPQLARKRGGFVSPQFPRYANGSSRNTDKLGSETELLLSLAHHAAGLD